MDKHQEPLLKPAPDKPAQLRALLASGRTIPLPGAFNAICAKIIEEIGFPAVYISGAGIANGIAGYPDIGMMTQTEMAQQAGYIARSVNLPAICDADTGFGEAISVFRTVQEYERAGLSGIHIEDQVFPKRCGHLEGKQVIPVEAMVEKLIAAVQARQNAAFLIIARVDSNAVYGFADLLERADAYLQAGADMIFPEALETAEAFETFARQIRQRHPEALLLANMTEFGKTPYLTLQDFERLGYNIVIYPLTAFRVMMKSVYDTLKTLHQEGTQSSFLAQMTTRQELYNLIHYSAYERLDASIARQKNADKNFIDTDQKG